ncbi:MAG TPA: hypothetical protein VNO81_14795, partial [Candidatus Nitrosotenuis sp.]|nr:hypothetical protein [Candidatus Nitrosotenuis sp.]
MSTFVTDFRFTGFDASGAAVFGPTTRPKAATVVLTEVPITVTKLRIEYLGNGEVIGVYETEVTVPLGGSVTVAEPAWSYVEPKAVSFGAASAWDAGGQPLSVAVGDLNG